MRARKLIFFFYVRIGRKLESVRLDLSVPIYRTFVQQMHFFLFFVVLIVDLAKIRAFCRWDTRGLLLSLPLI